MNVYRFKLEGDTLRSLELQTKQFVHLAFSPLIKPKNFTLVIMQIYFPITFVRIVPLRSSSRFIAIIIYRIILTWFVSFNAKWPPLA